MSLFKEWDELATTQTEESFPAFWKEYCEGEAAIYNALLEDGSGKVSGTIDALAEAAGVRPVIYMGFLDGIQTSLKESFDLTELDGSSEVSLDVDFEKLLFNMHDAKAEHLYALAAWENVFSLEKQEAIFKEFRRSKIVVKGPKIGRNDPCPCGSGKKYKHCCGKNA